MPDNKFIPPSNAVEVKSNNTFVPPSNAVEVKKKETTELPLNQKEVRTSLGTQKTKEQKPSVSSGLKDEGVFEYKGRPGAIYKKTSDGNWSVDVNNTGVFKSITDPKRISVLEKQATPTFRKQEDIIAFEAAPKQEPKKILSKEEGELQKSFAKDFKALSKNDPTVVAKNLEDKKTYNILKNIDSEVISASEGEVVPKLINLFKGTDNDIFDFEETGAGYDAIKVTNRLTGESKEISLDNWSTGRDSDESKLLKGFIDVSIKFKDQANNLKKVKELEILKQNQLPIDAMTTQKQIDELQKDIDIDNKLKQNYAIDNGIYTSSAIYNKEAINNTKAKFSRANIDAIDLKNQKKDLDDWKKKADESLASGTISQEEYNNVYMPKINSEEQSIIEKANKIQNDINSLKKESQNLDTIAGHHIMAQEERGNILTGAVKSFIKGVESPFLTIITQNMDNPVEAKRLILEATSPGIVTDEYLKSANKSDFETAMFGLTESIGSVLAGGPAAMSSMFVSSYGNYKDEINSTPGMENIPEYEKMILSAALAAPASILEKFGVDKVMQKSPIGKKFTNWILSKAVSSLPKKASSEMLEKAIAENLKAAIGRGIINVAADGAIEGITEGAEALIEGGIKTAYNALKDKDYFDTPKTTGEWLDNISESAKLGLIGGATIGSMSQAVSISSDKMTAIDFDKMANLIEDENLKDILKTSLKAKVLSGEISRTKADELLSDIKSKEVILNKIPTSLNPENKYNAFKLIDERSKIEQEIAGKDPSLVGPQQDRINAINEELKAISNQKQEEDATKESTKQQQESPTVSSSVQYQGVDEGQQEVGQREGAIREAEKQGADISNRPIEGRGVQEEKVVAKEAELFDDVKNANDENELARLYNEEVNNLSAIDEKEKAIHSSISKIKKDSYARFGDVNNISQGMAKTYFNKNGLGIDQVAQEASQSLTGDFASEAITPQDVVDYINKYPNGFNPTTPSGNPRLRAINEKNIELTGKQLNSRIAKIKVNNAGNMDQVVQKDSMLVQAIETAGLLKTMDENINDEGFWTQFPGGFTKEEYELIKKEYNEANREELERISNETESRTNWATEDDVFGAEVISEVEAETTFDEVKNLDTTDKTNLQKVQSFLDNALNDLDAFGKETLGMNVSVAVARVILKTVKRLVDAGVSLEQAFKQAARENNVQETDVLDAIEKIQNKKKESEASKAAKTISKKEVTKVTVNEYQALKDQIKLEARAARESAKELKSATKNIGESVNDLVSKGKLTTKQAGSILSRFSKLNVLNTTAVDRYLQYVDKIFKNANYLDDLNKATSLRNKIKKYKKNNAATVADMAGQFYKIDPAIVDNLNEYTATAESILNAIKSNRTVSTPFTKLGFKSFETEIKLKEAANINAINSYTEKQLAKQEEILLQEAKDRYREYIDAGIISENVTLEQITSLMKELKGLEQDVDFDEKQKSIEEVIKKEFLDKKSILEDMLKNNGINPLTGEQVEYSEEEAVSIKKLLDIDISLMKKKDIFLALNAMDNFLENGIIDGVNKIVAINKGNQNIKKLVDSNYVARNLKIYFSNKIGRFAADQLNDIHKTLDRQFGGVKAGDYVANLLGFTDVKNGIAKTDKKMTNLINEYTSKFLKLRPNGKNFNSFENIYERGIFADLIRSPKGSEFAKSEALIKRIKEVKASYENLLNSTNKDKKKEGEIIKSIYDKLNLNKKDITIDEISLKVNEINKDSVQWFVDKWAELYPDLESKSLGMDNTMLVREDNYTPDVVRTILGTEDIDSKSAITSSNSFVNDPSNFMNKNKAGVLYPSKKVVMGEDKYLSFDFDNNNFRRLRQAILDLNISEASYTLDSALKDKKMMAKLFPNEDDRAMIDKKITSYVNNAKGMRMVDMANVKYADKFLNSLAKLGASFGLSAISQFPTQYFGALANTLAQAGEFVDVSAPFKKKVNDFINRTDTPTANRGKEAITSIESASRYIDKSPDNAWEKTKEVQNKVVDKYLDFMLKHPDIWAARTAFVAYYKQSLKRQGLNYKNLDWENLEVNREAADYAESMVSRQQNTSDQYDKGAIFTNKNLAVKFLKNTLLPFASYAINQHMRMQNDLITLVKGSQAEKDRVIALRSLAGFVSEQIVFHAINYFIAEAIAYFFTDEDDEEKEKRKKRSFNYRLSRAINDIISPVPLANDLITKGINSLVTTDLVASLLKVNEEVDKEIDKIKKKRELGVKEEYDLRKKLQNEKSYSLSIFSNENNYGMYGIAYTKFNEAKAIFSDVYTGEVKIEDQHDKTKTITKYLMQEDRDKLIAPLIVDAVYLSGAVRLREMHKYAMAKKKEIEKNRALTAKEYDIYSAIKEKKSGIKFNPDGYQFVLIKSGLSKENVIDEIKYIEENGGLKPELTKEYEKLRDYNKKEYKAELDETDIKMLQQGKTAEQIIKTY